MRKWQLEALVPKKAMGMEKYCLDLAVWQLLLTLDQVEEGVRNEDGFGGFLFVFWEVWLRKAEEGSVWRNVIGKIIFQMKDTSELLKVDGKVPSGGKYWRPKWGWAGAGRTDLPWEEGSLSAVNGRRWGGGRVLMGWVAGDLRGFPLWGEWSRCEALENVDLTVNLGRSARQDWWSGWDGFGEERIRNTASKSLGTGVSVKSCPTPSSRLWKKKSIDLEGSSQGIPGIF